MAGDVVVPGLEGAPAELRSALRRLLLGLADTKRLLGIRYSDWLLGAPSIEAGIAASSMAQDEWGHARLLYAALRDFGDDPVELEHAREPEGYLSWGPLDEDADDWAGVVASMLVLDGVLTEALSGIAEGRYEPLEGRITKMLAEEEFHASLATAWFRRLAGSEEGRARLRAATEVILEGALLGAAPGDDSHERLAAEGLTLGAGELRGRMADRLDPLLSLIGLSVPTGAGLPADWDEARGRGPGAPPFDSIERARGDRNRALFVE